MEKIKTKTAEAQGAETVPERVPSKLYAMKAFKGAAQKLIKLNMVGEADKKLLEKINSNLLNAYLMGDQNVLDN